MGLENARFRVACAIVLVVLAASRPSFAADDDDHRAKARALFGEAQDLFAKRDFAKAADRFEAAARLVPFATTWLNAAEASERAGDPVRAADDADHSLADSTATDQTRAEANERLARLGPRIGTLVIESTAGASVRIDGEASAEQAPLTRRLRPGPHVLSRTDRGTPEPSVRVDVVAGNKSKVDADSELTFRAPPTAKEQPKPTAPPPHAEARTSIPTVSILSFGVAGAAAVVTGVFGALTLHAQSAYDAAPSHETLDTFKRDRLITNVALSGAIVFAATGAIVWLVAPHRSSVMVTGSFTPNGIVF